MSAGERWSGGRVILGVLQAFVGVGAAFGGFTLVSDRSGGRPDGRHAHLDGELSGPCSLRCRR